MLGREKQFFNKKRGSDSSDEGEDHLSDVECPNCHELIPQDQTVAHTVACYRSSTKCKICGEVICKEKKKEHLDFWRDVDVRLPLITG